jgi:hypothetical protein
MFKFVFGRALENVSTHVLRGVSILTNVQWNVIKFRF